jgi:hypothetical protein
LIASLTTLHLISELIGHFTVCTFVVHRHAAHIVSTGLAEQTVTAALAFEMVSMFTYVMWIL